MGLYSKFEVEVGEATLDNEKKIKNMGLEEKGRHFHKREKYCDSSQIEAFMQNLSRTLTIKI